jgi:linoleoyl-CoA desaturase
MAQDSGIAEVSTLVKFGRGGAFSAELKQRADAYFEGAGRDRRDLVRMYLKSAVVLGWFVASWVLLVFFARALWQSVPLAMSLGLSVAAIGMSIQHDANHGGYSRHRWVNRAFGFSLDVMGVSGHYWKQKHNIIHHTFTNVQGVDFDLDFGDIARLSPEQPCRPWHRYQQYYLWVLYGLLLPKWVFYDDFTMLQGGRAGIHPVTAPKGGELAIFYFWKVFFVCWALAIPAMFHPLWQVLVFHFIAVMTLGVTLSSVFQLAHCVDSAEFPAAPADGRVLREDWAAHQVDTTVDFAPGSALLTWFLGGLNFQVEHHLFPKVCHLHYPALRLLVSEVAQKHGVRYRCELTLWQALSAHYRQLAKLGAEGAVASHAVTGGAG